MDFFEKDLEQIIFSSDRNELEDRGLKITGKLLRQKKIGNYGICDLIEINRIEGILSITVYELKKDKIGISSFLQAIGYTKGIKEYINIRKPNLEVEFKIVLIGCKIDLNSTFSYLPDLIPLNVLYDSFLDCITYEYKISGIEFKKHCGYRLIDNGFNI